MQPLSLFRRTQGQLTKGVRSILLQFFSQYRAMSSSQKKNVLIIGGGAVGAIAALNLEAGGLATVTLVLRSNYNAVNAYGFDIQSTDHGRIQGWKPSVSASSLYLLSLGASSIKKASKMSTDTYSSSDLLRRVAACPCIPLRIKTRCSRILFTSYK